MPEWSEWLAASGGPPEAAAGSDASGGGGPSPRVLLALLGVVVLAILTFFAVQVVGEGERKSLDAFEYHYPFYEWFYAELASGRFPLWNPHQLCGIPTLATLQGGFLYPPHLLYVLLPTDLGMAALGLFHLLLIGAAVLAFAWRAGASPVAALLAALLVTLGGAQPGHLTNPSMQEAGAWLGVGFLGVLEITLGERLRGATLVAVATGLGLLAGFPQFSVYAAYAWGFLLVALLAVRLREPRTIALALCAFVGAVGLGALIAAVQLLPALELAEVGGRVRGVLPLDWMLPFGRIGFETPIEGVGTALASRPALPDLAYTFGWVSLLLAPFALFASRDGGRRRLAIGIFLLGTLTFCFAIGPATPLFDLMLKLPEVGTFRNPWRILFVTDFCVAIAAAFGLDALLARLRARAGERGIRGLRAPVVAGAIGIAVVALALFERLIAPGSETVLPYDRSHPRLSFYHQDRPVLDALARRHERVWTHFIGDMGDVSEKLAAIAGIRSISDNEIMTLARQREYFTYLYWGALAPEAHNAKGYTQQVFYGYYNLQAPGIDLAGVAARARLVELASARFLLAPRTAIATPALQSQIAGRRLRPADVRDPQFIVYEDPAALPRAYVAHHVEPAPEPETLLAMLSAPDFDPRAQSYVEAPLPELASRFRAPGSRAGESARLLVDATDRVEVDVTLSEPGLLVLSDSYYPGWQAEVDGEPAAIHATNHLFRGVALEAGHHHVVFRYRPKSVYRGAVLSAVGVGLLAWLAASATRARD